MQGLLAAQLFFGDRRGRIYSASPLAVGFLVPPLKLLGVAFHKILVGGRAGNDSRLPLLTLIKDALLTPRQLLGSCQPVDSGF